MLVAAPPVAVNPPRLRFGRRGATALLAVLLLILAAGLAARSGGAAAPATAAPPGYGELPVAFVANAGQSDARVRYLAQGGGYGFFFTDHGVRLALSAPGARERAVALELGFVGANPHARPVASERAAGTVSYLGAGHGAAQAGLATFGAVTYRGAVARDRHGVPRRRRPIEVRVPRRAGRRSARHRARLSRRRRPRVDGRRGAVDQDRGRHAHRRAPGQLPGRGFDSACRSRATTACRAPATASRCRRGTTARVRWSSTPASRIRRSSAAPAPTKAAGSRSTRSAAPTSPP